MPSLGKNYLGRIPRCPGPFAKQYALEISLLLTRIDERLNEESKKSRRLILTIWSYALDLLNVRVLTAPANVTSIFLSMSFRIRTVCSVSFWKDSRYRRAGVIARSVHCGRSKAVDHGSWSDVAVFSEMTATLLQPEVNQAAVVELSQPAAADQLFQLSFRAFVSNQGRRFTANEPEGLCRRRQQKPNRAAR